ncbi:MAG: sulfotransferase family protein [Acidimicrobiales bacterium]
MLSADQLVDDATTKTGLSDFGGESFREGLDRLTGSLRAEGNLNELGEQIFGLRLSGALQNRLRVEETIREHPEITEEVIEGPIVILGLPRTGTTVTSQLVALDPAIRSLRLWESSSPVPPPESATQNTDPRIAETEAGLQMMYETFPRMKSLHYETATGPTECLDLLSMEFRTAHYDGMAHVPSYTQWVVDCDMDPAYRYHRRVLQLLQWHCPPRLWHLKTPVHMFALGSLADTYPDARFLWTHRDPAEVLGSVCSLIAYTRSWVSDRDEDGIGEQQVELWCEALMRAVAYREQVGEVRFCDISFADMQKDPVDVLGSAYDKLGLVFSAEAERRMADWRAANPPGAHGAHEFSLDEFGLSADAVRERFSFYLDRFGLRAG